MTAKDGDIDGGPRSITIYHKNGDVVFESNSDFETAIIQAGQYPDKRSDAKGVEPEGAIDIRERSILATANEVDLVEDGGGRSLLST
jgi:hypothetical protein